MRGGCEWYGERFSGGQSWARGRLDAKARLVANSGARAGLISAGRQSCAHGNGWRTGVAEAELVHDGSERLRSWCDDYALNVSTFCVETVKMDASTGLCVGLACLAAFFGHTKQTCARVT